jgi:hypothetical protein
MYKGAMIRVELNFPADTVEPKENNLEFHT